MKLQLFCFVIYSLLIAAACNKIPENKKDKLKTEDVKKQDEQSFTGAGFKTYNIHLNKGMAAISFQYFHADSFRVTIYDTIKTEIGTVRNKPEKTTEGLERITIPAEGNYILEIKGSGKWFVSIW